MLKVSSSSLEAEHVCIVSFTLGMFWKGWTVNTPDEIKQSFKIVYPPSPSLSHFPSGTPPASPPPPRWSWSNIEFAQGFNLVNCLSISLSIFIVSVSLLLFLISIFIYLFLISPYSSFSYKEISKSFNFSTLSLHVIISISVYLSFSLFLHVISFLSLSLYISLFCFLSESLISIKLSLYS